MAKKVLIISSFCILLIIFSNQGSSSLMKKNQIQSQQAELKSGESSQYVSLSPDFGKIPLYFIPNQGQVDDEALFYAKTSRYTLWLTEEGLVFDRMRKINRENTKLTDLSIKDSNDPEDFKYEREASMLVFIKANKSPEIIPENNTKHKVNYFKGSEKSKWQTNIQTSRAVLYRELYPNIDLKVYGIEKQIEYDFVVKPDGEVSDIRFEYRDIEQTSIDKEGNLVVKTQFGELGHAKPVCYQLIEGGKVVIPAEFKRIKGDTYGFNVKEYNKSYELIIDPLIIVFSTYLGGSTYESSFIAVDSEGAIYVTGNTYADDFPTHNPFQGSQKGGGDVFITKINASGSEFVYSTYLGGSDEDGGSGIAVDSEGTAYVTGSAKSNDFPLQNPIPGAYTGERDAFITKVSSSGSVLVYSTYLGGSEYDISHDITVDSEGAVYVTGISFSTDFPTQNPIQGSFGGGLWDAFITKINPSGNALVYSTLLGGSSFDSCYGIAVDSEGAVYVTGYSYSTDFPTHNPIQGNYGGGWGDIFVTKINASGSALAYSTFLGGADEECGKGIAVDSDGSAYVVGDTKSVDFPIKKAIQANNAGDRDAFITKINTAGNAFVYSTYLGGSDEDAGTDITVDSEGNAFTTGFTKSYNFPTQNPILGCRGGEEDAFITKVNTAGNALIYSTYLGGSGGDKGQSIARDLEGAIYVTGYAFSSDFPTKDPIQKSIVGQCDAFITKLEMSEGIRIVSWNILNYPDLNGRPREEYYHSVIESLGPDILLVQEMAGLNGVNQFLNDVLKPISKNYKAAKFFDGPDTDNALFYDKSKFKVQSRFQIPTSFRDISEYRLKIKKGPGKGRKLKIFSVHFTEGLSGSHKSQRENEANTLRAYLNGLPLNDLFLVCGTFNMTASKEKAYSVLTGDQLNEAGRLIDPISQSGKWHDKKKFRNFHTESTRKKAYRKGATGGLDDRYDMILISSALNQNGALIYRPGSCIIYGNDGQHLNQAVNMPQNKDLSPEIAEALYQASDHLPVIIDLVPKNESK